MSEIRILFTGVGRRIELLQAFRSAALVLDRKLKIYGADMAGTAPALAYCDFTRKVVAMKDPGYIDNLLDICGKDKIDLLIPTIDTDLLVLSENREKFEAIGTKVLIADPDKIRICRDKNNTSQFFVDCGLKAPMPVNDVKAYNGGFPAFIKPKDGSSSINAFKVENAEDLEMYARQVEDYIIQPFVSGKEYTIDAFCDFDGNPISIVPRQRLQVRAGEVLKTQIFMDETMVKEAVAICEKFRPRGPITIQLIRDEKSGEDYYIEINPRYGGGAPLSMKAGARSAEYVLIMLSGEKIYRHSAIADGAIYSRFDQSVCLDEGNFAVAGAEATEAAASGNAENTGAAEDNSVSTGVVSAAVKAVIFDLDDTLYPERAYVRSGYKAVAKFLGDDAYADRLYELFEQGKPAIDALLSEINRPEDKEKALDIYRTHKPEITMYPEMKKALETLRARGIKLGIITDGRPNGQNNKIDALGVRDMVDEIVITDELGGSRFRKPCDIAFRIMQVRFALPAEEIMYVGDNITKDFAASMQLGMKSLYFKNPEGIYYTDEESAFFAPHDIKGVCEALCGLPASSGASGAAANTAATPAAASAGTPDAAAAHKEES
ncbi:HAD-IA family hydrolase [Butyrivibrio sp. FCS014]|uniref:HAD-IA family hydrolase n=1 Tax=Butyrivibrio sp. FCS014 TaxID=1408304 RepID=UPI000465BE0A|nr:HAD-IA family hydrolase [Butyrivibrio sp. FCS014]